MNASAVHPLHSRRATGTRDPLLRQACPRALQRAGGRARRLVGHRIVHPLQQAEQRVPDTAPSLAPPRARLTTRLRDFATNRHE